VPIAVACQQCGRAYRVAEDKAGRQFHCKQCGNPVPIPSAPMPADPQADDPGNDEYGDPVLPRPIRPPKSNIRPAGKPGARTATSEGSTDATDVPQKPPRRKMAGLTILGWIGVLCSIAFVTVVLLCAGLFLMFRNEQPAVLADPTVRPLVDQAMSELQTKNAALEALIHFEDTNWLLDQEKGTISFDSQRIHAVAPVQIIGTYNTADGTWLWAWDNPSLVKGLAHDSQVLREYGQKHGIAPLTTRKLNCDEVDCWEFTALACKLCEAQAAYRGPSGKTRVFMTLGKFTMSKTASQ